MLTLTRFWYRTCLIHLLYTNSLGWLLKLNPHNTLFFSQLNFTSDYVRWQKLGTALYLISVKKKNKHTDSFQITYYIYTRFFVKHRRNPQKPNLIEPYLSLYFPALAPLTKTFASPLSFKPLPRSLALSPSLSTLSLSLYTAHTASSSPPPSRTRDKSELAATRACEFIVESIKRNPPTCSLSLFFLLSYTHTEARYHSRSALDIVYAARECVRAAAQMTTTTREFLYGGSFITGEAFIGSWFLRRAACYVID